MPDKPPYIVYTKPLSNKGEYEVYSVSTDEFLGKIKGDSKKKYWEAFDKDGKYKYCSERKKQCMDYFRELDKERIMAQGGGIGFEKLSKQIAKNYEGKKVAPKYQHEYGKTYSKSEAQEVGDKVAGKVYWQQQGRKMATGGGTSARQLVVLDEGYGKVINNLFNDWTKIKSESEQEKWNEKVRLAKFGTYGTISIFEVLDKFDFDKASLNEVVKRDFKKEINNALKYARGGNIKKYDYSPSVEEQESWSEEKSRIYDTYANSYNTYQDLLEDRKRAIKRNDKDEVKSIDLRLKNKLATIKWAYSELTGTSLEEEFAEGGNMDDIDTKMSKAIFRVYGDIDDAIEFKFYYPETGVPPYRLVYLAIKKGFITPEEITKDLLNSAYETSSETADAEEIGSSDMNYYVWSMLRDAGFDMKVENGYYVRVGNKMATGGNTPSADQYIRKSRERQAREEEGKYFAPYRAFVYSGSDQFADFKGDDFHKAVSWAKQTLEKQKAYRKSSESLWAIVDEFTPIEERGNVIYPYKEVARFTEENIKNMKFATGGSMSSGMKTYYIILNDGSQKEFTVANITEIPNIYFSYGRDGLEKGTPMVHYENALNPLFNEDGTYVNPILEYAGKDYWEFKNKMATGGQVEEPQEYYRVFRNNAGKDVAVKILKNPIFGKYDYYVDGTLRGQFDTFSQARQEVNYENFDMYKRGGGIDDSRAKNYIKDVIKYSDSYKNGEGFSSRFIGATNKAGDRTNGEYVVEDNNIFWTYTDKQGRDYSSSEQPEIRLQFARGGGVGEKNAKWKNFVLNNKSWFDDESEEGSDNEILLTTRENGDVGNEEWGREDVNEAKQIVKKIISKFPTTQYKIEQVDEYVYLYLRPNKSEREIQEEIEAKNKQIAKLTHEEQIINQLGYSKEKAEKVVENLSNYPKEYYEKYKDRKNDYNNAFRVLYTSKQEFNNVKFSNLKEAFDYITRPAFANSLFSKANPIIEVLVSLYGWDCIRIKYNTNGFPYLPDGETNYTAPRGKTLSIYPFLTANIESSKDLIENVNKGVSEFIKCYEIVVLENGKKYDIGGSIEENDFIIMYFDDESETGKTYEIGGKKFDNESDAKSYARSKGYSTEVNEFHYGTAYAKGGGVGEIKIGDEVIWEGNKYRFAKTTENIVAGLRDKKYHLHSYKVGVEDAILDSLKGVTKYENVEDYAKGGGVFNSEFYKDGGSIGKEKYAYVQAETTSGNKVFRFFEKVPTHKEVYAYFRTVKDEHGNPITLKDATIHVEEITDFDRKLFLEKANEVAISTFGSPIKELDDMMFSFDKHNLSVFKFEAELENGTEVSIQTVDGVIVIEAEEEEDKFRDGGSIDINFKKDTDYIKRENIKLVKYKNGKELYNWDYWDSYNVPAEKDELFLGIYVAHRPLPDKDADKQYSMFKAGGKLPETAFYIKRSDIDSVIVYDENKGEEIEIPANRIVNGIWFDNERTQTIIDRARKEGLLPDKTKKTTTFIARFNGKKIELEAKSTFDAEQKAIKELKVPKSKRGLLSVMSKQAYERGDFQFN